MLYTYLACVTLVQLPKFGMCSLSAFRQDQSSSFYSLKVSYITTLKIPRAPLFLLNLATLGVVFSQRAVQIL